MQKEPLMGFFVSSFPPGGGMGPRLLSSLFAAGVQNLPSFDAVKSREWGISNRCNHFTI